MSSSLPWDPTDGQAFFEKLSRSREIALIALEETEVPKRRDETLGIVNPPK